jgi:membrane protein
LGRVEALDTAEAVARHVKFAWYNPRVVLGLITEAFGYWFRDNVPRLAASLAYYSLLSVAPLLVVVIAVAGLLYGREAAQGQILWQIKDLIGFEAAQAVEAMIAGAYKPAAGVFATLVGVVALFFGASSAVAELQDALNTIWRVAPPQGANGVASLFTMLRNRFLSFAMVMGVGFLLLVSLVISAWLAALGKFFGTYLPLPEPVLESMNLLLSFLVIAIMFAVIYKVLPDVAIAWSDVVIGAVATSLLFSLGKFLIGFYLGKSTFTSTYGAAASIVVILVWVYYSAQIFFLGAEFTKVYANRFGSHLKPKQRGIGLRPVQAS